MRKSLLISALLGIIFLLTSCPNPIENIQDAPYILNHSFSNNDSDVPIQTSTIEITFSKSMGGGFSINHNLGDISISWISSDTLQITLNSDLQYNQEYELVLNPSDNDPAFMDLDGNALTSDTEIKFTTESETSQLPIDINVYSKLRPESQQYLLWIELENNTNESFTDMESIDCSGPGINSTFTIDLSSMEIRPGRTSWQIGLPDISEIGDSYNFQINYKDGTSENFESQLPYVYQDGPEIISPINGSSVSLNPTISWSENNFFGNSDADAYCVQVEKVTGEERIWSKWFYSTPSSFSIVFNEDGTASEQLVEGGEYYFIINALGKSGSWTSNVLTVRAGLNELSDPRNIVVTPSDSTLTLTWDNPVSQSPDHYEVFYGSSTATPVSVPVDNESLTAEVTGLDNGELYYFRIFSVDEEDNKSPGILVSAVPLPDSYLLSHETGSASMWFGGDNRSGFGPRNVAAGQSVIMPYDYNLKEFSVYITRFFDYSENPDGYGHEVTMSLVVYDEAGSVVERSNEVIPATFNGGWIGFDTDILLNEGSEYLFGWYVNNAYTTHLNSGVGGDASSGYAAGRGYSMNLISGEPTFDQWYRHSWDFKFKMSDTEPAPDPDGPVITSYGPGGTSVEPGTEIRIQFSKAMNLSDLESSFIMRVKGGGTLSGSLIPENSGTGMRFTPSADYIYGQTYEVVLPSGISSTDGGIMQFPFSFEFTTKPAPAPAPEVQSVTPAGSSTGISVGTDIIIDFSVPMNTSDSNPMTLYYHGTGVNSNLSYIADGTFSWQNNGTRLIFVPHNNLPYEREFEIRIWASTESAEGVALGTRHSTYFTTEVKPFTVDSHTPTANYASGSISVTFSEPVDVSSFYNYNRLNYYYDHNNSYKTYTRFTTDVSWSNGNMTATMTLPPAGVDGKRSFLLYGSLRSESGKTLGTDYSFEFYHRSNPAIISTSIADFSSEIPRGTDIVIEFDKRMDTDRVEEGFRLKRIDNDTFVDGSFSWERLADRDRMTFSPGSNLRYYHMYNFYSLSNTYNESISGGYADSNYDIDFTTVNEYNNELDSSAFGTFDYWSIANREDSYLALPNKHLKYIPGIHATESSYIWQMVDVPAARRGGYAAYHAFVFAEDYWADEISCQPKISIYGLLEDGSFVMLHETWALRLRNYWRPLADFVRIPDDCVKISVRLSMNMDFDRYNYDGETYIMFDDVGLYFTGDNPFDADDVVEDFKDSHPPIPHIRWN